jgi:hypothetical protein
MRIKRSRRARRRHTWVGFAIWAVLAIIGLFVLHGTAAGATLFAAFLVFIFTCIYALRGEDPESAKHSQQAGTGGWLGGGF